MKSFVKYLLMSAVTLIPASSFAQDCNIPMCVVVDKGYSKLTSETSSVLETQLQRLAMQSKVDIGWNNARFAITAKFDQMDKFVTGTAPAQIVNVYGVTLSIVDVYNQKLFASTYIEAKGVGTNETKASLDAVKRLNANNDKLKQFMQDSKQQIINYYDSQIATILKEAEMKATMKEYDQAMAMLAVVPSCCNGYEKAMTAAKKYYVLYRDTYYTVRLNKARALWASDPTPAGSEAPLAILSAFDPEAKCYPDAMKLLSEIARSVKSDIDYEVKKKYEDEVELEKLRIQSIGEIAKAYAASIPKTSVIFLGNGGVGVSNVGNVSSSTMSSQNYSTVAATPSPTTISATSGKLSGAEIFQKYGTAVFTIELPSASDATMVSQGSGFFIDGNGTAVTNYHVLDNGNLKKATIKVPNSSTTYSINKVLKSNKTEDYAVISVNCSQTNYIPVASNKPCVGEKVYAIGSPKGFENTISSGEVSQWRGNNLMQTTVMIDHGSSGGALINESGQVVGITSGTFDSESVANLNYAISIDVIK